MSYKSLKDEFATPAERKEFNAKQEEIALATLRSTTRLVDGHYEVGLLFRPGRPSLPDNRRSALQNLYTNEARSKKDPMYGKRLAKAVEMYEELGFARKLTRDEVRRSEKGKVWHLPYFLVYHPRKPGKPRLAFDASRPFMGRRLNDELFSRPDLLTPMFTVLIRFREHRYGVSMDVRKMFHMARVPKNQQSFLRYVYRRPGSSGPPETFQMLVHIFGATCSMTCCVYALQQTARDHPEYAHIARKILECFYVDNFLDSFESEEEAISICASLIELLKLGGFDLEQMMSNSKKILDSVPPTLREDPSLNLHFDDLPNNWALGMLWNCQKDCLAFRLNVDVVPSTKRELLRAIAKIFDPFGFLIVITIRCWILLQEVWRNEKEQADKNKQANWDRRLPTSIQDRWSQITGDWACLNSLEIPRCIYEKPHPDAKLQLHVFCDASMEAMGATIYLRSSVGGDTCVSLLAAKAKVAPLQPESIPHYELKAARLAAKLEYKVRKALRLNIDQSIFWSDSQVVLSWIKGTNRKTPRYVAAHRDAILKTSKSEQWNYVPSHLNPADDVSRGIKASELNNSHRFFKGPKFLRQDESSWPVQNDVRELAEEVMVNVTTKEADVVLEFIEKAESLADLKKKVATYDSPQSSLLTPVDLFNAFLRCIKSVQSSHFNDEIKCLSSGKPIDRSSRLKKLDPFIGHDGLLRVGGRLGCAAALSEQERHQIILPSEDKFTELVIMDAHISALHSSTERTHFDLRATVWILKGKQSTGKVVRSCIDCKRRWAPAQQQKMADLPEARVTAYKPVFYHTGVDYLGPFYVTVKRSIEKRWICLFTCLSTRAVHLELAFDLSAASFLNVLSIFSSLRGKPAHLYGDNGTNLRAGERELRERFLAVVHSPGIVEELAEKGIEFHFNPPAAPHMGAWEEPGNGWSEW